MTARLKIKRELLKQSHIHAMILIPYRWRNERIWKCIKIQLHLSTVLAVLQQNTVISEPISLPVYAYLLLIIIQKMRLLGRDWL